MTMTAAIMLEEKMKPSQMRRQRRREKSRDAARFRRHKESDTFEEICNTIPVPHDVVHHLDKAAIMRLLISYIKLRQAMNGNNSIPPLPEIKQEFDGMMNSVPDDDYVHALNAFVLILASDLDILYVSDNVKEFLGLSKLELIGQSILLYAHEGDHDDIKNCFNEQKDPRRSFFLRLKSTLTVSGKSINLKSASYKVLRCSGLIKTNAADSSCFVAHVEPIPHPANIEHFLDSKTFVTQHTPDMQFSYCDDRFAEMLGYDESDLLNHSYFDFCHVADLKSIGDFFHKLYKLGQTETKQYRFLAKSGGYYCVVTQATVVHNQKNQKPQCVVCIHYVISGLLHAGSSLSSQQLLHAKALPRFEQVSLSSVDSFEMEDLEGRSEHGDSFRAVSDMERSPDSDNCSVAPLNFKDLDEQDDFICDDLCYNAPSIGDPWTCRDEDDSAVLPNNKIEDLFSDVVLDVDVAGDQEMGQSSAVTTPNYSTNAFGPARKASIEPHIRDMQLGKDAFDGNLSSPGATRDSGMLSPARSCSNLSTSSPGSLSPCDSAYCGSPAYGQEPSLPYTHGDLFDSVRQLKKAQNGPKFGVRQQAFQSIRLPQEKYSVHFKNLKRGYVETVASEDAVHQWPKKNKTLPGGSSSTDGAKRRCLDTNGLPLQCNAYRVPEKKISYAEVLRNPIVLVQPGESCGIGEPPKTNGSSVNFLLQPELNFNNETGKKIVRNMSSGFLPELSLQDCEVNAPLPTGTGYLPMAADCVHALDLDF